MVGVALSSLILLATGCPEPDPPADEDGGTGDPPVPPVFPNVVFDGEGRGVFLNMEWGGPLFRATAIGTPNDTFDGLIGAGRVSLIGAVNPNGPTPPVVGPQTIIEQQTSPECPPVNEFPYFLGEDRNLGGAFTFYSRNFGPIPITEYDTVLVTAVPVAGSDSGRVLAYDTCIGCVMFPRVPDTFADFGNEMFTRFGSSVAVGFFENASHSADAWLSSIEETMAVGAPLWEINGGVHLYDAGAFNYWDQFQPENDRQCDVINLDNPTLWRWRFDTLTGGFNTESFGAVMVAADFNCDGFDDLAVGAPDADVPAGGTLPAADAGAVHVFFGGPLGLGTEGSITLTQGLAGTDGTPEDRDRFGASLAVGNVNGARTNDDNAWSCWDLIVGAPGEDDGAGEVQVFLGNPSGLSLEGATLRLGEGGLPGTRDPDDHFGAAVFAMDIGLDDGIHDVFVGAPGDGIGGTVTVVPGSVAGPDPMAGLVLSQGANEVAGADEEGDEFGFSLSVIPAMGFGPVAMNSIMVGAPGEDDQRGSVFVVVLDFDDAALVVEGSIDFGEGEVGGSPTPGDRFGSVLARPRAAPRFPFNPEP